MSLDLSVLNPEQRTAVEEIDGPCMIIAGAGSGKTRVLTYKVAYLIESGVNPFQILALTFTNKAANEMKERVASLVKGGADKLWMGTFHSVFARILRMEGDKIGFNRNFTIYDTDDSVNVVKQVMAENGISTEKTNPRGIHSTISYLKNKLISPDEFSQSAKTFFEKIVEKVYPEYQSILLRNNSMDFDDLLMKPIELFIKCPDILEKYQERFKFILIDEYQPAPAPARAAPRQRRRRDRAGCQSGSAGASPRSCRSPARRAKWRRARSCCRSLVLDALVDQVQLFHGDLAAAFGRERGSRVFLRLGIAQGEGRDFLARFVEQGDGNLTRVCGSVANAFDPFE